MEFKTFTYEKENNIAVISLSRPKSMNAISSELILELGGIFDEMKKQFEKKINSNVKINVIEVTKIESLRCGTAAECPIVISKIAQNS